MRISSGDKNRTTQSGADPSRKPHVVVLLALALVLSAIAIVLGFWGHSPGPTTGTASPMGTMARPAMTGQMGMMGRIGMMGPMNMRMMGPMGMMAGEAAQGETGTPGQMGMQGQMGMMGSMGMQGPMGMMNGPGSEGETGMQDQTAEPGQTEAQSQTGMMGRMGTHGPMGMMGRMGMMMGPMSDNFSWSRFEPPPPPAYLDSLELEGEILYSFNCAGCHGDAGRGNGWRANFLYPRPRNFTRGIFRFKTTPTGSLPTDRDIFRTISTGIQGSAMPTWGYYLTEGERWRLVAYVKTFSRFFREDQAGQPLVVGPVPAATLASVESGKQVFVKAGCVKCHGEKGYGDGVSAKGMEDSFGVPIRPRNFHQPYEFNRGRTLFDIATTVHTGNDGTPMPSFHGALTNSQIWEVASYVMSMDAQSHGPGCGMMSGMSVPPGLPPLTPVEP